MCIYGTDCTDCGNPNHNHNPAPNPDPNPDPKQPMFEHFLLLMVLLNTLCMAIEYEGMSQS